MQVAVKTACTKVKEHKSREKKSRDAKEQKAKNAKMKAEQSEQQAEIKAAAERIQEQSSGGSAIFKATYASLATIGNVKVITQAATLTHGHFPTCIFGSLGSRLGVDDANRIRRMHMIR